MSQIDQAFIKAYGAEQPVPPSAQPTIPVMQQGTGEAEIPHAIVPDTASSLDGHAIRSPHFPLDTALQVDHQRGVPQQETVGAGGSRSAGLPEQTSQPKLPLSSFSAPPTPSANAFRPVFEVDQFPWPAVTNEILQRYPKLLIPVAEQLAAASESGRSMIAIAGARRGVGTTTALLCLARMLASVEKEVAIVDADFATHALGRTIGLDFDTGWEDVLTGQIPLAEGVVHSIGDNISLLPLAGRGTDSVELLSGIQASISSGVLRYHYDVVLFDLGNVSQQPQATVAQKLFEQCRIDSSILVADAAHTSPAVNENIEPIMSLLGSTCLGVIGNSVV